MSETLGVILMFGLLMAALTIVQVNAVPTQNAKVEYAHDQTARTDFQEVRTAIIETAGADEPRSATVDLGVTYPGRLLFLNPGPVNGQLQAVDAGAYDISHTESVTVDIQRICGIDDPAATGVPTKALEYGIDYHVYSGDANHLYENTIVHQRSGTNGADLIHNDQQVIRGNTISLYPLVGDVQYSGTSGQSIDFVSGGTSFATHTFDNAWELAIPTKLDATRWETDEHLLAGEANVRTVSASSDGVVVEMEPGKYSFRCTPIGLNEAPPGVDPIDDTDDSGEGANEINPNDPAGSLVLKNAALVGADGGKGKEAVYELTLVNTGEEAVTMTDARLNFYYFASPGTGKNVAVPVTARIEAVDDASKSAKLTVRGQYQSISNGGVTFSQDDATQVRVSFYTDAAATTYFDKANNDDYFVLSTYVDGGHGLYFVAVGETIMEGESTTGDAPVVETASASMQGSTKVAVDFTVTDSDGDLSTVNVVVQREGGDGTWQTVTGEDGTIDVSGSSATDSFTTGNLSPGTYRAIVTVSDSEPGTSSDSTETNEVDIS